MSSEHQASGPEASRPGSGVLARMIQRSREPQSSLEPVIEPRFAPRAAAALPWEQTPPPEKTLPPQKTPPPAPGRSICFLPAPGRLTRFRPAPGRLMRSPPKRYRPM